MISLPPSPSTPTGNGIAELLATARRAQACWGRSSVAERLQVIRVARRLLAENGPALARAAAAARQRPVQETLTAEVLPLAAACRFLEKNAGRLLAPIQVGRWTSPFWLPGVRAVIHREPLGVILVIGPGHYPLFLSGVQVLQVLVAGNAVLLKPGLGGAAPARALASLLRQAGLNPDLLIILPESVQAAREAIAARPDKVVFTGSAATGANILEQLAPGLIPAVMELSGSDAVLVRGDADLELTVKALQFGLSLNAGQTCLAPKRVFIHRRVSTEIEGRLAKALGNEVAGKPTPTPPPASTLVAEQMRALLVDAVSQGARFLAGGVIEANPIRLPAVLAGVAPSSRLLREEIFAPVMALVAVDDDDQAVACANASPYALGASVFTRDESVGRVLASRLRAGIVTLNDLIVPSAHPCLPFGGRGRSGFGVTRGGEGLLEFTGVKVVTTSRGGFRPAFEPAQPQDGAMLQAYLQLAHGRGLMRRARALITFLEAIVQRVGDFRKVHS